MSTAQDPLSLLLVKVANQSCQESYQQLFNQVAPRLLGFARLQFSDESLAFELVQETMLKVWLKATLFDPSKGSAINWIYSVARNVKFDLLRKNRHQQSWISGDELWPLMSDEGSTMPLEGERPILNEQVYQHIDSLPIEQADIVRRVYRYGQSQQEIADQLSLPLGTVKSRLRLALKKIQEAIDERH